MPRLTRLRSWAKDHRAGLGWALGLGALLVLAAVVMPAIWRATPSDRGVVAEWNDTIARLGIDPVARLRRTSTSAMSSR
jgi:hypothetical protein